MLYRALRGVCIGVDRHLKVDDTADLDPATGKFLTSIGAVEEVKPEKVEPPKPEPVVDESLPSDSAPPAKSGKKEK
jgi:hypothetical protein